MGEQEYTARRISRSPAATRALGRRLGGLLQPGDVVALTGDLGAGKTELVRGVCAGARVLPAEVSSPTFAIVATYRGRIPVHHADLYRIGDEDELYGTGFGDLVGAEGALLVEWADRIPGALPAARLSIRLDHDEKAPSVRRIAVSGVGARHAALARKLVPAAPPRRKAPPARRASRRPAPSRGPSRRGDRRRRGRRAGRGRRRASLGSWRARRAPCGARIAHASTDSG